MNSPAKRRKTDKDVTPRRHGKNIDSFFGLFPGLFPTLFTMALGI